MAIPKVIHYCWFGGQQPQAVDDCIETWKQTNPDFEIKKWSEENFQVELFPFTKTMYEEKKWAFVADYVRLYVLQQEGGFYLDTDMLLLKSLNPLSEKECVLGEEEPGIISAGMIGAQALHPFITQCKAFYDTAPQELITIPRVLSKVYNNYPDKASLAVYPPRTFYPFNAQHIKDYTGQDLGPDVLGVHLWHHSWGHPLNKFFKKIGVYGFGKRVVELLGIKQVLKKLFGFI